MLTDAGGKRRNGVSGAMKTVGLAVLVFAAGALAGFVARLVWPARSR